MNKKVLRIMIILAVLFLASLYILKGFFPKEFMISVQNSRIIQVGTYIDSHKWLSCIYGILVGMGCDYLYFSAVCRKFNLGIKLYTIIIGYSILFSVVYNFCPMQFLAEHNTIIMAVQSCYMIFIPMFFTDRIKELSITYSVNYFAQALSLEIRDIALLMTNANCVTTTLMSLECYFWMALLSLYFNYKKGGKEDGIL